MLSKKLDGRLGQLDEEGKSTGRRKLAAAKDRYHSAVMRSLNYAAAVRTITALADQANRYVELKQSLGRRSKPIAELTRGTTLTAVLNAMKILTIYLKPILPAVRIAKVEKFLQ